MSAQVMIVGGGVAGTAAAITLAERGTAVLLLERDAAAQHKVCGEFLSQEALGYLHRLGVDPVALGAVPIHAVRLAGAGRILERPLPFAAMSLTRKTLDEALLARAHAAGADVRCGVAVQSLTETAEGWCAQTSEEHRYTAGTAMLATGKHDLRGHARPQGSQRGLIAFKMYWRLAPPQAAALAQYVELTLFRGGYAGLQPVEGGAANLCCVVDAHEYKRLGGRWPDLLAAMCAPSPHLAARLAGAEPLLHRPLAIASIPYGFVRADTGSLWRLGDQAAVIPSFTGDGISLALHSGVLAGRMHAGGATADAFQQRLATQVGRQVRLATWVSQALVRTPRGTMLAAVVWPGALQAVAKHTRLAPENLPIHSRQAGC